MGGNNYGKSQKVLYLRVGATWPGGRRNPLGMTTRTSRRVEVRRSSNRVRRDHIEKDMRVPGYGSTIDSVSPNSREMDLWAVRGMSG